MSANGDPVPDLHRAVSGDHYFTGDDTAATDQPVEPPADSRPEQRDPTGKYLVWDEPGGCAESGGDQHQQPADDYPDCADHPGGVHDVAAIQGDDAADC